MSQDFKKQLNDAVVEERNKLEQEALNKAEGMIKSLVYRDEPAHESFREELKAKIVDKRHAPLFMKLFQVKIFVPIMAMMLLLSLVVGAYQLGAFKQFPLAKFLPKKDFLSTQFAHLLKKPDTVAKVDNQNPVTEIPKIEGGKKIFGFTLIKPAFAKFEEIKGTTVASLLGDKIALTDIKNLAEVEKGDYAGASAEAPKVFSAQQKQALTDNNFFLADNFLIGDQQYGTDDFVDTYSRIGGSLSPAERAQQNSVFISSDYALHLYHLLIDRSFQKIEETKLEPRLKEMTTALFNDSLVQYRASHNQTIKDSYKRLAAYYLVPAAILEAGVDAPPAQLDPNNFETFAKYEEAVAAQQKTASEVKPDIIGALDTLAANLKGTDEAWIYDTALAELTLIDKAETVSGSPLFTPSRPDFKNDYTQFTPRSHYTKNKVLKTYFLSMMWYGRMGFVLNSPAETRDAIIITGQVNNLKVGDKNLSDLWADTMALIDFFVGKTDDLTPYQYTEVMKKVFGEQVTNAQLASDDMMKAFKIEAAKSLVGPKILSEVIESESVPGMTKEELLASTMQFRFMGQRFTPDAYILNQLTQGAEAADKETNQKLPSMPTALMPVSVISPNNAVVKNYLDAWVKTKASDSDKIIAKNYNRLVGEFLALPATDWNQNIYWSWLDCYRPLLSSYGQGYPFFMKGDNWQKKNLGTVLGSYTELKHDTLLYAKQSYAERGGGPGDEKVPPAVKGYVEADSVFWNKLLNLAKATSKGLEDRNFMPEEFKYRYDIFIKDVSFFKDLSDKELKNEKISDDDFEKLRTITEAELKRLAEPLPGEELQTKDRRAGIVADIHTDALKGQILYEATAKPLLIYVAVKDVNGTRLTVGAAFDQREFAAPLEKRLTDEDWQAIVYEGDGQMPVTSDWTKEIAR